MSAGPEEFLGFDHGFDPFLDWDAVEDEMVNDLHSALLDYEKAKHVFMFNKTRERAVKLLQAQLKIGQISSAIHSTIATMPVMVHVAGPRIEEIDEEGHDTMIQRCKRCGSMLQFWHEGMGVMTPAGPAGLQPEDVPWWGDGQTVAKGTTQNAMAMYEIDEGRPLAKHERPCPALDELDLKEP